MKTAIVTLDGFNELDSFIALAILNRVKLPGWSAQIVSPDEVVTSMNGVKVIAQQPLEYANDADIVLFGSGIRTVEFADDEEFLARLQLDTTRQLIGAQCSGALFLHSLGFMQHTIATDTMTGPLLEQRGLKLTDRPMHVEGNVAAAGGCLASHYLAAWVIAKAVDWKTAEEIIHYVAPVGQKDEYARRAAEVVVPLLHTTPMQARAV